MMSFPKIAHLITDMNGFGGTEATLLRYLKDSGIPRECHKVFVLKSIGCGDMLGAQMVAAGISVLALNQKRSLISPFAIFRLYRELRKFEPDILSGWLYHPSLLSSILALFLRRTPKVVWHIRSLPFASFLLRPGRFIIQRVLAVLSHFQNVLIVSNSSSAMDQHIAIGFDARPGRWSIIPNGIDATQYFPMYDDRNEVRRELDIPVDAVLIGCVGRFVPEKGYSVMFNALASAIVKLKPATAKRIHFLAVGNGVDIRNSAFREIIPFALAHDTLHFLGKRSDVSRLLRAIDIFVLPSISEAFPNSLVEAMATGLPCIATNVGECAGVLNNAIWIVPRNASQQLAERIVNLVEMPDLERQRLGGENRRRIVDAFSLEKMVLKFDKLFENAVSA